MNSYLSITLLVRERRLGEKSGWERKVGKKGKEGNDGKKKRERKEEGKEGNKVKD